MVLWVDKHRPTTLDKLDYHEGLRAQLTHLASSGDFPHLLVYGPSGAGKKTRIVALLREIYGAGVEKLKIDLRQFQTSGGKKLEINVVNSNYHMEMTPGDVGNYDRIIVTDLIKEIAQTQQIDSNAKRPFKVVILNEADGLSRDAQSALRRTMEKYMTNLRIILVCESTSKIISPIRSRCLLVRVAAPEVDDITRVITKVCKKEGLSIPPTFATRLAESANGNLRKAILMLEAARIQQYPFEENQQIFSTDWERVIKEVAMEILNEQSPAKLLKVRQMFYELLSHCIPADLIIKQLAFELMRNVDGELKKVVVLTAAQFEHRLRLGNKSIFHLEAFVARFMAVYKSYLMEIGAA
ncbi:P-loop containing nucleoside triphosphate hydrolase protein [Fimicolochytrium jonesii]|uniref:P-loop containing nucleoside triphosphate hydrolase protein n=1 Tax=Fimicolochytrium jonesii TaxID=1396493 RepID=UPI0022FF12D0|nr:P-loop containing nucleoside triphosphate hydrolase protein [Fimicolochytrium jonesii]KAI8822876.1 P-loop containing nucleoside triphosphate hydrolase protein [Fimicolochytrium jonesii]